MPKNVNLDKYFKNILEDKQIPIQQHLLYGMINDTASDYPRALGSTSLMYAAFVGNLETVQLLLQIQTSKEHYQSLSLTQSQRMRLSMSRSGSVNTSGRASITPDLRTEALLDSINFYANRATSSKPNGDLLNQVNANNQSALDFACKTPNLKLDIIKLLRAEKKSVKQTLIKDLQLLLLNPTYRNSCNPELYKSLLPTSASECEILLHWAVNYGQNIANFGHIIVSFLPKVVGTLWKTLLKKNIQGTYKLLRYIVQFVQIHYAEQILLTEKSFSEKPLHEYMTELVCQNIQFEFYNRHGLELMQYCIKNKLINLSEMIKQFPLTNKPILAKISVSAKRKSPIIGHLYQKPCSAIKLPSQPVELPLFNLVGFRK
eukprot:EST45348.1 Hypothetical protein SS50377_14927 [Spironucleus salmonicida]